MEFLLIVIAMCGLSLSAIELTLRSVNKRRRLAKNKELKLKDSLCSLRVDFFLRFGNGLSDIALYRSQEG